jgi:YVTN family beta-propeller protein
MPFGVAVNPKTNTLYVTNYSSPTVWVISGRTNTVTASISDPDGAYGVAVNPKTNTVYVGDFSALAVISGRTNTVTAHIGIGAGPGYGVAVDPKTNRVYVAASDSHTVTVLGY